MIDSTRLVSIGMILDELTSCGGDYLKYIVIVINITTASSPSPTKTAST